MIGIELCQEAVEDAKMNAKLNGTAAVSSRGHEHEVTFFSFFLFACEDLSNVEFHCGKAEDVFPNILNALVSPNVTAIVDPPRAGLRE